MKRVFARYTCINLTLLSVFIVLLYKKPEQGEYFLGFLAFVFLVGILEAIHIFTRIVTPEQLGKIISEYASQFGIKNNTANRKGFLSSAKLLRKMSIVRPFFLLFLLFFLIFAMILQNK